MSFAAWRESAKTTDRLQAKRVKRDARGKTMRSFVEQLEGRQLLASSVLIDASNALTLIDSGPTSGTLSRLTIDYDAGTQTYTLNQSSSFNQFVLTNLGTANAALSNGNQTLTVSGISGLNLSNSLTPSITYIYNVNGLGNATTVTNNNSVSNTVNLSSAATGSVANINGALTISDPNLGLTLLNVFDAQNTTPHTVGVSDTALTGVTSSPINYSPSKIAANVHLYGGDQVTVSSQNLSSGIGFDTQNGGTTLSFLNQASLGGGAVSLAGTGNTVDYSAYLTPVTVNEQTNSATGVASLTGVQNINGGSAGDTIVTSNQGGTINGNGGDDSITLGSGNYTVNGGAGNNTISGGGSVNYNWNPGDGFDNVTTPGTGPNAVVINAPTGGTQGFNLSSSSGNSVASLNSSNIFSIPTSGVTTFDVLGSTGNDTLTVDFSGGNPIGNSEFLFDGGAGSNTLNLQGGSFSNEAYAPQDGVYGSGMINLDATSINFQNLRPINDITTATNFTLTPPAGLNQLAILDGPTYSGTATTQIASQMPSPTFELINIGNKQTVSVSTSTSGDTVILNNPTPGAGMQNLNITEVAPSSSLRAFAAPNGVATSAFLGGNDVATVTAVGLPASGSFSVNGGSGINTLNVDGAGTTTAPVVGASTITFGTKVLNYLNFQTINLTNVLSAPPTVTSTNITAVAGTALINKTVATFVGSTAGLSAANYGATINWGDGTTTSGTITQDASNPTLFYVTGTHTYQGGAGSKTLTVSVRDLGGISTTVVNGSTVNIQSLPSDPASQTATATVADAQIVTASVPISGFENTTLGNPIVATFSTADQGAVPGMYSAIVDWGDGSAPTAGTISSIGTSPNGVTFVVNANHTYVFEGRYTVHVTITSTGGSQAIDSEVAQIADLQIGVIAKSVTATAGTPMQLTHVGNIVDSGGIDTPGSYSGTINWGDGVAPTAAVITFDGTNLVVWGSHTFAAPGFYSGTITVRSANASFNTATLPITVAGLSATDLPVTSTEDQPLNNVPLISLAAAPGGPAAVPNYYSASIDWGDATPITPGAVDSSFQVLGNHTYKEHGTYNVKITVATAGNPNLLVYTRTLTVDDVPVVVNGSLDPSSDSGVSHHDGITNVTQPLYNGTTEALATVTVTAYPTNGGAPITLGTTTADSSGAWHVKSTVAIPDGTYNVIGSAIDRNNATHGAGFLGELMIDTVAPKVTAVTFNRMKGQLDMTFQDNMSGMAQSTLIDNSYFSFTHPRLRPGRLLFTSLTATQAALPTDPQTVTGLINGGQPLRGGTYVLTITSGGITDVAGNALDGNFYGYFPSGDGKTGSDFVAVLDTVHARIYPPKPLKGYSSPLNPPGTLETGFTVKNRNLVPNSTVTNLFRGQQPNAVYSAAKTVVAQTHPKAVVQKSTKVAHPAVITKAAPKVVAHQSAVVITAKTKSTKKA